jgi:hypothetical protein
MDFYQYIAENNPVVVKAICNKYGYKLPKGGVGNGDTLKHIVSEEGESALKDVCYFHPDKDLILEVCSTEVPMEKTRSFYGVDGSQPNTETQNLTAQLSEKQVTLGIVGAVIILGLAIVMRK